MNHTRPLRSLTLLAAGLALSLSAAPLRAEPPTPPSAASPSDQPAPSAAAPAASGRPELTADQRRRLREWLERRLAATREQQSRLERALTMLDANATSDELRSLLPDLPRNDRQGRDDPDRPRPDRNDRPDRPDRSDRNEFNDQRQGRGPLANRLDELGPTGPGLPSLIDANPAPANKPPANRKPGPLTDEDRQAVREFVAATSPALAAKLTELEKADPAQAEVKFQEALPRLRWLLEIRSRDPELYQLRLKDIEQGRAALNAARAVAKAEQKPGTPAADLDRLRSDLQKRLESQYQLRTALLDHEVKRFRDRVEEASRDVEQRSGRMSDVVQRSMTRLIDGERKRLEQEHAGQGQHKDRPRPDKPPRAGDHPPEPGRD